jgi:hypothetical protein
MGSRETVFEMGGVVMSFGHVGAKVAEVADIVGPRARFSPAVSFQRFEFPECFAPTGAWKS